MFFGVTRFRCRQRLITGGERKTRFVPRSLVQGTMEGPREREEHKLLRTRGL